MLECFEDFYVCIPFRSNIQHGYAYKFKDSARAKQVSSGLDYSKILIIKDSKYIADGTTIVDKDEYNEAMKNMSRITEEVVEYIQEYINHITGT